MDIGSEAPWVNPVYHSAECTCQAGSACVGAGHEPDDPQVVVSWGAATEDGATPTGAECRAFCTDCERGRYGSAANSNGCELCAAGKSTGLDTGR